MLFSFFLCRLKIYLEVKLTFSRALYTRDTGIRLRHPVSVGRLNVKYINRSMTNNCAPRIAQLEEQMTVEFYDNVDIIGSLVQFRVLGFVLFRK